MAKAKLNGIEETFTKAIRYGEITDEEFNEIEREVKGCGDMK